ncbi:hypothetical protein [Embleya sp. NPDC059237]|uniref:hypothetical protein n=1 Tax=Embleya sp. NPDC059237 TaxID=3346784 RepID=UPI003698C194
MIWFLYALIGYVALGTLLVLAAIGKPRQPITNGTAMYVVLVNAAIIVGLVMTVAELR